MLGTALTVAKVGFTFLKGNWSWALPTIGLVAALAWGGWQHVGWNQCAAAAERLAAKQAKAIADQKDRDRLLGNQIVADQHENEARVDAKTAKHTEIIRHVTVTVDCANSPGMRAADDGLRDLGFSSEEGPAPGGADAKAAGAKARPLRRERRRQGRGTGPVRRGLPQARKEVRRLGVLDQGEGTAVLIGLQGAAARAI